MGMRKFSGGRGGGLSLWLPVVSGSLYVLICSKGSSRVH